MVDDLFLVDGIRLRLALGTIEIWFRRASSGETTISIGRAPHQTSAAGPESQDCKCGDVTCPSNG